MVLSGSFTHLIHKILLSTFPFQLPLSSFLFTPGALLLPSEVWLFFLSFLKLFYWLESAASSLCPWPWNAKCPAVGGSVSHNELICLKCQLCACCLVQATVISHWYFYSASNGFLFLLFTFYNSFFISQLERSFKNINWALFVPNLKQKCT